MRVDLGPIVEQAKALIIAIEAKSESRSSHAAHVLLGVLPSPTWAETAPGCRIYYGEGERELESRLNLLRRQAMNWLGWLIDETHGPNEEWPEPKILIQVTRLLGGESVMDVFRQNASVSANTAPTMS
jgi:hypothetical protein